VPIRVNPAFTQEIVAGFVVCIVGALLALAASIPLELAKERVHAGARAPVAWRILCAAALGLFLVGTLWQLVGYLLLEYTVWWTW